MSWLHHPRFLPARDAILGSLRAKEYHFRRVKRVAFLCGGLNSPRRDRLADYIRRHREDFEVFYAEAVWTVISQQDDANALDMEAQLAGLADAVIIVVESAGTFTELGAFSLSPQLRQKLLPILPQQHRGSESFINTGPIRWIDQESIFRPAIWTDHNSILAAADALDERLGRLPKTGSARVDNLALEPKHLLFFVCDLIAVFGPTSIEHLEYYCSVVLDDAPVIPVPLLVGLAEALGLVRSLAGGAYYYRPLEDGRLKTFQYRRRYIDMTALRAEVLECLQRIEGAGAALTLLRAANDAR